MKPMHVFAAALLAALPLANAATPPAPKPAPNVQAEVTFVAPENFTDVRDSYTSTDAGRDGLLDQIREYIVDEAPHFIPPGYKLFVSFTEIDMAGDFEPWRGPRWDDIRIVKDIYPPRMNLSFRLTDPAGTVVKEAKRELRDTAFLMKITSSFQNDPLRHEKEMISDWMRDEFRDLKKK